jgi:DNA polymerase I
MPQGALDKVRLHFVNSLDELDACRRWAGEARPGPLFFDTESGGLSPYHHRLRLIQLGDTRHGWAFPAEGWGGAATELLGRYAGEIGAHNSPYDYRVLKIHTGLELPWHKMHDTLIAGHLVDSLKLAALKPRAAMDVDSRVLRGEQAMEEGKRANGWTWDTVPVDWPPYHLYGALDTVAAAHLWEKFGPVVQGQFAASYSLERATLRICANMMLAGMKIDVPFIERNISERLAWYDKAMAWLQSAWGLGSVNSNAQVGAALNRAGVPTLVFTDSGLPSLAKETLKLYLNMFPDQAPLIRAIAICRKTDKVVGTYLRKFLDLRTAGDIMHYTIWSSRARTGRQSVTEPPMQTYDRDEPVIRGSFIPREGTVFITIDADQIEARLTAHFSGDQRMIQTFRDADASGRSFFRIAGSQIYGVPYDDFSKRDPRYNLTKNATYGQIYGSGLDRAALTAGVPVEQMQVVYSAFRQMYPGVKNLMDRLVNANKRSGQRPEVRTMMGRRLYGDRGHEYALLNYMVQGSAAEVMKRGLADLDAAGFGSFMRLTLHDEVLMEVPREMAEAVLAEAVRILTDRETFSVPITWAGSILEDRWRKT